MRKNLLLLLFCVLMSLPGLARDFKYAYEGQTITYTVIDEEAKTCKTKDGVNMGPITGNYVEGDLILPANPKDGDIEYTLIEIGIWAFGCCDGLTSVEIPNTVTSIESYAFDECYGLTSVEIPNSVKSIGNYAFYYCNELTSIVLPESVTSIGEMAFMYCEKLPSIKIPNSVESIGGAAFECCSGLTSVEIPNSVTSIGDSAFSGCSGLTSVEIPNSVTSIGGWVFEGCSGLASVEIPNSVTSIGMSAFQHCSGLASVEIPNSVTSIGECAFRRCISLTSVVIPNSVTEISWDAFYDCDGLIKSAYPNTLSNPFYSGLSVAYDPEGAVIEDGWIWGPEKSEIRFAPGNLEGEYSIPETVTSIGESAFYGCSGLTSLKIGNAVTSIGENAFSGCDNLKSLTFNAENCESTGAWDGGLFSASIETLVIGDRVTRIPSYFFCNCDKLTSLNIPNSVTSIGDHAFAGCTNLSSVKLPDSLTAIVSSMFSGCEALKSIEIPNTVTAIEDWAFSGCGFTSLEIPGSVTSIGDYAFYQCHALPSLELPNSITEIGEHAFYMCSGLKSVVLPNSLRTIGGGAFQDCDNLVKSAYPNTIWNPFSSGISIGYDPNGEFAEDGAIYGPEKSAIYFLPYTFEGEFTIPESVLTIGKDAFAACDGLSSVVAMPTVPAVMDEDAFNGLYDRIVLTIPDATVSDYLMTNWSEFKDIRTLDAKTALKDYSDGSLEYRLNPADMTAIVTGGGGSSDVRIPSTLPSDPKEADDGGYAVKGIGYRAFDGMGVGSLEFEPGSRIEGIGEYAFRNTRVAYLNLPTTVRNIHQYAFYGCDRLREVKFGSSLESLGRNAFCGFSNIKEAVLPPTLETIGDEAFQGAVSLSSIVMGHNVKSIGENAFDGCPASSVSITAPNPPIAYNNTFSNYSGNLYLQDKEAVDAYFNAYSCWYRFNGIMMIEPTGIELVEGEPSISGKPGEQFQLKAALQPEDVTLAQIFWSSTNPDIATVDSNGLVTLNTEVGQVQTRAGGRSACKIIAESLYADGPLLEVTVTVEGSGVDEIQGDAVDGSIDYTQPYDVYNMNGLKVSESTDGLSKGIYIIRQGKAAVKTVVKQ